MSLNAANVPGNGPKIDPIEAGAYPARLVQVIDIGVQEQGEFAGKAKPPAQKIILTYELQDEFMKDDDGNDDEGKPRWMSEEFPLFNLQAERAKSTTRYKVLDPHSVFGGDFAKLLETPVNVSISKGPGKGKNAGRIYNNVMGITAVRPKDAARFRPLVNKAVAFDMDDPDMEVFEALPNWIKRRIEGALNYQNSKLHQMQNGGQPAKQEPAPVEDDDDVPF